MKIADLSVRRPVLVSVLFIAMCLFGVVAYMKLPIDLFPEIELPVITVVTTYSGASAEDVEKKITEPLEMAFGRLRHLEEMSATSREGLSAVSLRFGFGTDLDEAANDIRQYLEMVSRYLPEDADKPLLIQIDMSMFPVLIFAVTSSTGNVVQYRDFVEDNILDPLKRLEGVGSVMLFGAPEFQVNVEVRRDQMDRFGISMEQLTRAVQMENFSMPSGSMDEGVTHLLVRMPAEFSTLAEMEEMIVARRGDSVVRLKDVAVVSRNLRDTTEVVRVDGMATVAGGIMKQSDANVVDVADAAKKEIERLQATLPSHMTIVPVVDTSVFIRDMMDNLMSTLLLAVGLVVLVVLLFLREFRSSLIVGMALPGSMIIAFFALYVAGFTMNVISMMAMVLAIGMVVDNAIVVLEIVTRHLEWGKSSRAAAMIGTDEVGPAITSSTLTTMSVFGPMVFVSGLISILFNQLAFVVCVTIGASLFVAVTLTPMLCGLLLKRRKATAPGTEGQATWLERGYRRIITWTLDHRLAVVLLSLGIVATTFIFIGQVGVDFMPPADQGEINITVKLPIGTALEETKRVAEVLTEELRKQPEVEHVFYRAGASEDPMAAVMGGESGSHVAMIAARLTRPSQRTRSDLQIAEIARARAATMKEVVGFTVQSGGMDRLFTGNAKPITYEVRGKDLKVMTEAALEIRDIMMNVQGVKDVSADIPELVPELRYQIDREEASRRMVPVASAGMALRNALTGDPIGKFRGTGEDLNVVIRYREQDRQDVEKLKKVQAVSLTGELVSLGDLGTFDDLRTPLEIKRKDKERVIAVGGNQEGRALGDISKEIESKMRAAGLYSRRDVAIVAGGNLEQQRESFEALGIALLLGAILVYLVMAAQFESFLDPFLIIFSMPFAFTGAFLLLAATGTTLSLPAFLGLIILLGVVVNNAIVLVDYVNLLRYRQGMPLREALETAGERRLRPVLMTTLTTVVGLIPMAMESGEGSEFWRPLGLTTVGGLTVSTLVTLVLVPVLYSLFERFRRRRTPDEEPTPSPEV